MEQLQKKYDSVKEVNFQEEINKLAFENVKIIESLKPHEVVSEIFYEKSKLYVEGYDFLKNKEFEKTISLKPQAQNTCQSLFGGGFSL